MAVTAYDTPRQRTAREQALNHDTRGDVMARIRSMKPEFWSDRRLATRVSRDARLLYVALWNFSDEHSRLQGDTRYIKGNCLPYDDDLDLDDISRLLAELESAGRIHRYEHDGDPYIYLPKLADHQRLEADKVPSRLPEPPDSSVSQTDPNLGLSVDTDEPARGTDQPARDPDENALLYVAGSRLQGAGSRFAPDKPPRAARRPDEVWDALLDACTVDAGTVTNSSRGAYNRAVADLRAVQATPDEIHKRATVFRAKWPNASLTPTALARRWAECERPPPTTATPDRNAQILANARVRAKEAEVQQARKALP